MGSRKNRLENEANRCSQAAAAAAQAEAGRKSLTAQVDAVLANNHATHLNMSNDLRNQLAKYFSGLRENTADLLTGLKQNRQTMTAHQFLALATADTNRRRQASADMQQRRSYLLELLDLDFGVER